MGQEFRSDLPQWVWQTVSHGVAVGLPARVPRLKARLGPEEPLPGWLPHVALGGRLNSSPCRPLHSVPWVPSQHGSWLPTEQVVQESGEEASPLYDLVSEVTDCHC